jgi:hypothetical protein
MNITYEQANQRVHLVETQWHYPILINAGFIPETLVQTGTDRKYKYTHKDGHTLICKSSDQAEYWLNTRTGTLGYWRDLVTYLVSIV